MILGLTGGIGAGKSTVARWFAQWGASWVSADAVSREVVEPGEPALDALVDEIGHAILHCDGTLDRPELAKRMFASPTVRKRAEYILHPAITARVKDLLTRRPHPIVYEAPLLFEVGHEVLVDLVCVVVAAAELRIERVEARDGVVATEVRRRIAAQWSDEERCAHAGVILENHGDLVQLEQAARELWDDWTGGKPLRKSYGGNF
ncbi:MAG: dephospho-CoA kinase [Deltaproteobacteria bacterium HGW-Deltaproteobacteria-22]|jgi:dephospho-CoA kinase|nr:MAG: dephospho-CoA kinase [Deltaproteobacteria bacterium HGW-Deltaproteobacteria-22]